MSRALSVLLLVTNVALGTAVWAVATGRLSDGAAGEILAGYPDAQAAKGGKADTPEQVSSGARPGGVPDFGTAGAAAEASWRTEADGQSSAPPLFRVAVVPPPLEELAAPPPPEPPPRLLGVIIGGTGAIAVMQVGDAQPKRLRVQDEVEGWTVTRIDAKRVVVQRRDEVATVRMDPVLE